METTEMRKIRLTNGANVLLERDVAETVTAGGIAIPEIAREGKSIWARVLAVGLGRLLPDGRRVEPIVAPGDRVVIEKWEGIEFRLDGRDLLVLDEGGVLGVVET